MNITVKAGRFIDQLKRKNRHVHASILAEIELAMKEIVAGLVDDIDTVGRVCTTGALRPSLPTKMQKYSCAGKSFFAPGPYVPNDWHEKWR